MTLFFQILSLFTIVATGFVLLFVKVWWIRIFNFPRVQIMFLMICCIAGLAVFGDMGFWLNGVLVALVIVSFLIQFSFVFPYLPVAKKEMPVSTGGLLLLYP